MNKQIAVNKLIRANRERNRGLASVVTLVCFFATATVGIASFTV